MRTILIGLPEIETKHTYFNMFKMESKLFGALLTILFAATGVRGGSYCTDLSSYPYSRYCDNGCCGNYGDQYCCLGENVGRIVGIVIGSIAAVAVVATILVIIFCCCRKSRGHAGVVNQPAAPNTAVMMYGQQTAYGQPAYPVTTTYSTAPYTTTQIWQQPPPNTQTWQQPPPNTQTWQQPPPNSQPWAQPPPYQQTEAKEPHLPPPSAPTH